MPRLGSEFRISIPNVLINLLERLDRISSTTHTRVLTFMSEVNIGKQYQLNPRKYTPTLSCLSHLQEVSVTVIVNYEGTKSGGNF